MANYSGFCVIFDEEQRSAHLKERGAMDWNFSDVFSAPDWGFKKIEICFLSFDGISLDYACLARRGNKVATAKYLVKFSEFVDLSELKIQELGGHLSVNLRKNFVRSTSGLGGRIPPTTWNEVIKVVKEIRPNQTEALERLLKLRLATNEIYRGHAAEIIALERDAVGVALDVFDKSSELRKDTLGGWAPPEDQLPPFLEGIEAIKLTEEQMLANDVSVFPNGVGVQTRLGAQFTLDDTILDVVYLNRTKVENVIGIDLIYYNHQFDAYTLVQYKRMRKEKLKDVDPESAVYRPSGDKNFKLEMDRMKEFRGKFTDEWASPNTWSTYRLNGDGFFFKFCPSITLEPMSQSLTRGMYLPREYVDSLLQSDVTDGLKLGKLISYDNVKRHFNNTEFTQLVRDGWIGTRGVGTEEITKIIRESLAADRAVIYARSHQQHVNN